MDENTNAYTSTHDSYVPPHVSGPLRTADYDGLDRRAAGAGLPEALVPPPGEFAAFADDPAPAPAPAAAAEERGVCPCLRSSSCCCVWI